jgi:hypothetical protein
MYNYFKILHLRAGLPTSFLFLCVCQNKYFFESSRMFQQLYYKKMVIVAPEVQYNRSWPRERPRSGLEPKSTTPLKTDQLKQQVGSYPPLSNDESPLHYSYQSTPVPLYHIKNPSILLTPNRSTHKNYQRLCTLGPSLRQSTR